MYKLDFASSRLRQRRRHPLTRRGNPADSSHEGSFGCWSFAVAQILTLFSANFFEQHLLVVVLSLFCLKNKPTESAQWRGRRSSRVTAGVLQVSREVVGDVGIMDNYSLCCSLVPFGSRRILAWFKGRRLRTKKIRRSWPRNDAARSSNSPLFRVEKELGFRHK
jgi:hypothetical protein